jgi:16S rRNA (cytidine1402-2'-O)-methyltransferase
MRKPNSRGNSQGNSLPSERGASALPSPSVNHTPGQGCLYLIATPIGNLEDISLRALRLLKEADFIACEDTRETRKLLSHYDIHTQLESYHEHNEMTRAPELVILLEQGAKIALVSDAGTPVVSDPGYRLVTLCLRHGIPVVPVPGPSALVAALAASGLPTELFLFAGFLPSRPSARRKTLRGLTAIPTSLVFYEAPHRVLEMLEDALGILGNRLCVVAREVTKLHEEFRRGRIVELLASFREAPPRGEITVILGAADEESHLPASGDSAGGEITLSERVDDLMAKEHLDHKAALKLAARERGLSKREAYKQLLVHRDD